MTTTTNLKAITPAEAMIEAQRMLSNDETLYDSHEARRIVAGLMAGINSSPCFAKALRTGCESFTLLETDPAAHFAVQKWAGNSTFYGHSQEKCDEAMAIAQRWRQRYEDGLRVGVGEEGVE